VVKVVLPIRLRSNQNLREHWAVRAKRTKEQRTVARLAVCALTLPDITKPMRIEVCRIGPRKMDRDNNVSSMKGLIDGIADALSLDDSDPLLDWVYTQRIGKPYAVEITIHGSELLE
jgi:hypothetical protein